MVFARVSICQRSSREVGVFFVRAGLGAVSREYLFSFLVVSLRFCAFLRVGLPALVCLGLRLLILVCFAFTGVALICVWLLCVSVLRLYVFS